jgi:hypothetical protein
MQGWGVKKINVIDFLVNAGSGGWRLHGMIVQQSGEIICKGGGDF